MTTPLPGNTSQTARLILGELGFQVGWQERIFLPAPAAGAQWSHTVDGRYYERLIAAQFTLTTDAVVATRFPYVELTDADGKSILFSGAGGGTVASSSVSPSLMIGAPSFATGVSGVTSGFLPDILIPPGWTWQSVVFGMDVADQISGVTLLLQRFPNDATVITAGE